MVGVVRAAPDPEQKVGDGLAMDAVGLDVDAPRTSDVGSSSTLSARTTPDAVFHGHE